jgi:ABC-type lipoprotein release transport system permease subunit
MAVALMLFGVSFVAAWLPAMRIGHGDPAELLRS